MVDKAVNKSVGSNGPSNRHNPVDKAVDHAPAPSPLSDAARMGAVIEMIYRGMVDITAWPAALELICDWVGAPCGYIMTPTRDPRLGGLLVRHGLSAETMEQWSRQYHAHDLWQRRGFEKGLVYSGNVLRDGDLVDENVFQHSKIYVEFLSKLNIGRILSGMIFTEADSAPFRGEQHPIVISLFHDFAHPFSDEAAGAIRLLIPHLSRALSVMFRLREFDLRISANQAALDLLPTAIVLFGGEGEVVFANQAARAILQENAGLQGQGLRLRGSAQSPDTFHLSVPHGGDQRRLDSALRELLAPQGAAPRVSRIISLTDTASLTLNLSILPETRQFGIGTHIPRAIGFLNAGAQDVRLDRDMLVSAYGLTGAEIRTAELILNGHSTDDAARSLNLSVNTIKTQINKIFEKTGTNSRSRLVKMLLYLSICSPVPAAAAATPPHAASTPARRPGETSLPLPRRQPTSITGEALAE